MDIPDRTRCKLIDIVMAKWFLLTSFAVSILIASCTKDELTLPVRVSFDFELKPHEEGSLLKSSLEEGPGILQPPNIPGGRLSISRGSLAIESIEFDGRRDEGRDVFFISDLPGPLLVELETGKVNRELSFDIPQGVYNMVEIYLNPGGGDTAPLILEGNLTRGAAGEIPVRFEYTISEKLKIRAESKHQSNKIVLRKDVESKASIIIDAGSVFQFVNPSVIRNASVSSIQGKEIIIVSPDINVDIFNALAARVEKSISIVFN